MMNLDEFVRLSLIQILSGIVAAQKDETVGDKVAPAVTDPAHIDASYGVAWHAGQMYGILKFDVAVTTTSSSGSELGSKGGVGLVKVLGLGFEAKATDSNSAETVSRLQFPVHFRL
jgi:hypothetical protein